MKITKGSCGHWEEGWGQGLDWPFSIELFQPLNVEGCVLQGRLVLDNWLVWAFFDGIFLAQTISVVSGEPSVLDHEHIWGHYDFESLEFKIRRMFSEGEKRMNLEPVFYMNSQRKELIQ